MEVLRGIELPDFSEGGGNPVPGEGVGLKRLPYSRFLERNAKVLFWTILEFGHFEKKRGKGERQKGKVVTL
jgi:hypothetical protein